ncbi:carboxymuconolactone decarboxylase family protein [Ammoniphilus sp. 3BR4]|uniref:carboxymuconolactone decarboxylase family protein n=1 Tax=Ammoniphilus sp. 3BR4 TaxID=3158265 RepID=UPI003466AB1F
MNNERYQRGLNKFLEYNQDSAHVVNDNDKIPDPLDSIAPDFRSWIIEFAYGDIYSRPDLDNKQRSLVTISSLVTQGIDKQLETHINRGLTAGLTSREVIESIIQLIPYVGFPRVQNALMLAKKVFDQRL